jgi:membrane-associated phospholipid phosphatase
MRVPWLVRDKRSRWAHLFVGGAATLILYQITNRVHIFEPRLLPFTRVDSWMPFWPWTVWIYFTEYLFFIYAYFFMKDLRLVTRYYYAYMTILLVSVIVFALFPVTFPRADYPAVGDSLHVAALNFLRTYMDAPANCLPSLHVSSCYISSLCFWQESRIRAIVLSFWSTLVAVSTMTTKQHYFIDVWTALILTGVCYWLFFYKADLQGSGSSDGAME